MDALDALERVSSNPHLAESGFRYCLVREDKIPYTFQGSRAHPNLAEDFCSLEELSSCEAIQDYAGIGISVNASGICAIDVDKCFSVPFDISSGDQRAKEVISMFEGKAYVEFSFSGKGLRVLFKADEIPDYAAEYYIKNDKTRIEYYQPSGTARYVTVTGMAIADASLAKTLDKSVLLAFLDKYMRRPKIFTQQAHTKENEGVSTEELMKKVRSLYLTDIEFQELWFGQAPGSGKNESQLDYHLIAVIRRKITDDKEKVKEIFEASPYFKSKDWKHVSKWNHQNNRYFEYIYSHM